MFYLTPPRHISTLPLASVWPDHGDFGFSSVNGHSQDGRACLKGANNGSRVLFDHLVGTGEQRWGDLDA